MSAVANEGKSKIEAMADVIIVFILDNLALMSERLVSMGCLIANIIAQESMEWELPR